jgi:3',5'-cyclic-AMP phosphodiesterase
VGAFDPGVRSAEEHLARWKVTMELTPAQHPQPRHVLVHMSDLHLVGRTPLLYGAVDSQARLAQIFSELAGSGIRPDAIVITGDLADKGEPQAYEKLRAMTERVAGQLGAQIIWVMGNHDSRPALRMVLLDESPDDGPLDCTYEVDGLRIITLDSTVPGYHHGEIRPSQLEWLARELSTPAKYGTVLAMHHPPVPTVQEIAVLTELRDQQALEKVIRNSDIRIILGGHQHYSAFGIFAGIPVSVASATSYTQDLNSPAGSIRGRDGAQGYSLVYLYEHTVLTSVVPAGNYRTVGRPLSGEETAGLLEAAGIYIPEPREEETS